MRRRPWVLLHRWVGLALALFVVLSGVTGALITFDLELMLVPELVAVTPVGEKKPLDSLLAAARAQLPHYRIRNIEVGRAPTDAYELGIAPRVPVPEPGGVLHQAFQDPYTGRILGTRAFGEFHLARAAIVPFIFKLHYALALGEKGMWAMGLVALLWIVLSFVGIYLALPKGRALKSVLFIKAGAGVLRLSFDLHRVIGLLSSAVLVVIAFSGLSMNWEREVHAVVSVFSPLTGMPKPNGTASGSTRLPLDDAVRIALEQRPGHRVVALAIDEERHSVRVRLAEPDDIRIRGQRFVYIDHRTGAVLADHSLREGTAGDVFIGWQLPLHSGQAFGLPGRVLVCVSGLLPLLMAVTGVVIWLRKRKTERKRKIAAIGVSSAAGMDNDGASVAPRSYP